MSRFGFYRHISSHFTWYFVYTSSRGLLALDYRPALGCLYTGQMLNFIFSWVTLCSSMHVICNIFLLSFKIYDLPPGMFQLRRVLPGFCSLTLGLLGTSSSRPHDLAQNPLTPASG